MRKNMSRILTGVGITLVFIGYVMSLYSLPLIGSLDSIMYDMRLRLTMPRTMDDRVVIVDIDEKSLRERERGGEGHWPWPRDRVALMLDQLFKHYGATVVGFDILFAERDESSGIRVLEDLASKELSGNGAFRDSMKKLRPRLAYDERMAASMRNGQVVLGYSFYADKTAEATGKGVLPNPLYSVEGTGGIGRQGVSYPSYIGNLPVLQKRAAAAGHINPSVDDDGVIRRVPLLVEHAGGYYESMSLAAYRIASGAQSMKLVTGEYGDQRRIEAIEVGKREIPVDTYLNALVPYRGESHSFPYYSAVDVIKGKIDAEKLKGRIVLVGTSAPGLVDMRATPVDSIYPGVEVHANIISGMLDGRVPSQPSYVRGLEFVSVLVFGLLVAFVGATMKPMTGILLSTATLIFAAAANIVIYQSGHIAVPLASTVTCVIAIFIFNMAYGFFVESRGMRQITNLFGQYVPPELVEEMAKDPAQFSMAPQARDLTVLFSDVRGFTTISESLSPDDLSHYINEYLTTMSLTIREGHRGTLDKYIGDAIMAFWGAPVADPQHARNAVLAALEMQTQALELNEKFRARNWPEFKIGVGVNTGTMRVGDMGSRIRKAYTVMGDAVNLGSRLEGLTKQYGVGVLIGENTRAVIGDLPCREVDLVRVKGKDQPVAIFEPFIEAIGNTPEKQQEIAQWHEALKAYRTQRWGDAEALLKTLRAAHPDDYLYELYTDRIAIFRKDPPGADWDGVTKFETK